MSTPLFGRELGEVNHGLSLDVGVVAFLIIHVTTTCDPTSILGLFYSLLVIMLTIRVCPSKLYRVWCQIIVASIWLGLARFLELLVCEADTSPWNVAIRYPEVRVEHLWLFSICAIMTDGIMEVSLRRSLVSSDIRRELGRDLVLRIHKDSVLKAVALTTTQGAARSMVVRASRLRCETPEDGQLPPAGTTTVWSSYSAAVSGALTSAAIFV